MRKLFNLFVAALVVLAAVSCEKNEVLPHNSEGKVVTLSATIDNRGTKTALGGWDDVNSEYPVLWSKGDKIAVIQEPYFYIFTLEGEGGTASGTFTSSDAEGFDPEGEYSAFYPAEAFVSVENTTYNYKFSQTQYYAQNSFGAGVMPMDADKVVGKSPYNVLKFINVFGVLKLQLKGAADEKVTSIVITSDNALNGEANLKLGKIVLSGASDENKKVTLDCSANGGVALNQDKATDFHIALPAGATGLKVLINTNKGSYYKEVPSQDASSNPINAITAGNILKMPELNTADMAPAYIENGVCYGGGIALPKSSTETLIWAPVNCGYDENHKYGLLYQWGRKYGQGYTTETYGETEPELVPGPVALADGQNPANANTFYKITSSPYDWVSSKSDELWNSGSAAAPVKTDYDPCPDGWRVPTNAELLSLLNGLTENGYKSCPSSQWTNNSTDPNHSGLEGFWFYGNTTETTGNKVFFPAAGNRGNSAGSAGSRSNDGYYWSSSVSSDFARVLQFTYTAYVHSYNLKRALGMSVRCVKE